MWVWNALGFLGGVLAVALTSYVSITVNRRKMDADTQARWEAALFEKSSQLAEAARSLRHHAEQYADSGDKQLCRDRMDSAQEKLRVAVEQLRLVGDRRVQVAARTVKLHAWAVFQQGVDGRDPRAASFPDTEPIGRLNDALQEFYRAVRRQLRAPDAEDVLHDDDLDRRAERPQAPAQRAESA
ncbi:hypothetical protein ACFQZ4_00660 [Catellatospora coxensis]|nr:hypothetical protein [Catellatospora coxensis]